MSLLPINPIMASGKSTKTLMKQEGICLYYQWFTPNMRHIILTTVTNANIHHFLMLTENSDNERIKSTTSHKLFSYISSSSKTLRMVMLLYHTNIWMLLYNTNAWMMGLSLKHHTKPIPTPQPTSLVITSLAILTTLILSKTSMDKLPHEIW